MPSEVDTFAKFVALLSASLNREAQREADQDADGQRGADYAARLYLSRSHFDRLIRAIAGEPPGRFRRRVLLERAAFRLRTSGVSVLTVAVEAGYSSHEAFTRAFARAYGIAPTAWRGSPISAHLPCPNGVHFHPPGGLRLPAREPVTAMKFAASLVEHHVSVVRQLLERAATIDDTLLDTAVQLPSPGIDVEPTIRSLLSRLIGQMHMWIRAMASEPYEFAVERGESVASMRERLESAGPAFVRYARDVCERDGLDETFVDATGDQPYLFTAAGMIGHVLTYAAYRRTAVVCALAALGADVDDDPLTWFAPE